MILEIESFYGDRLLHGKHMRESELRARVKELLPLVSDREFPFAFCMRYGYEIIPYDPAVRVDYVIDLDIDHIYKPYYGTGQASPLD